MQTRNADDTGDDSTDEVTTLKHELQQVNTQIIDMKKEQATLGYLPEQPEILANLMERKHDLETRLGAVTKTEQ